jgi:hypothetical protein
MKSEKIKWSIDYLPEDRIVHVRTDAALDLEENKELIRQVFGMLRKNKAHKILVEHSHRIKLSVLEIDKIPDLIKEFDFSEEDRAAVVYDPKQPGSIMLTFLRDVLYLSSYKLLLFTDKNKAVAWLKSEEQR